MVESAPLFIEYCAEGYMNYAALKTCAGLLAPVAVGLVGLAFCLGAYVYKLYAARIEK